MIPQYVIARLGTFEFGSKKVRGIIVAVLDENYEEMDWSFEEDVDAARIAASNFATQYRIPIAKITERLLNI